MVNDALAFHTDLAAAEAARPTSLTRTHTIIGTRQPTWTSPQINSTGVQALDTIDRDNDFGDGTVPLTGAIGHDLPMDTNTVRGHQHRPPHCRPARQPASQPLGTRRTRTNPHHPTRTPRADTPVPVRLAVPDLILANEPLPVDVDIEADRPPAIQIQIIAESKTGEREKIAASRAPKIRNGHIEISFTGLAPGAYDIRVTGVTTASVLVWTQQPNL
jgi:hypothetical protein